MPLLSSNEVSLLSDCKLPGRMPPESELLLNELSSYGLSTSESSPIESPTVVFTPSELSECASPLSVLAPIESRTSETSPTEPRVSEPPLSVVPMRTLLMNASSTSEPPRGELSSAERSTCDSSSGELTSGELSSVTIVLPPSESSSEVRLSKPLPCELPVSKPPSWCVTSAVVVD